MIYNYINNLKGEYAMALIKCPECGGNVSDKSDICVHCGYPIKNILNGEQLNNINEENHMCLIYGNTYDLYPVLEAVRNNDTDTAKQMLKA